MIPLYEPFVKRSYAKTVASQIQSGWWGPGLMVGMFEKKLAEYVGAKYAVCVNSGTTALYLALKALISQGHLPGMTGTVGFPAYGMVAGANAARLAGLKVKLADVDRETLSLAWDHTYRLMDDWSSVIFVCHNGVCGNLKGYINYSGVPVIQDACQQIGIGKFVAEIGIYSFSVPKLITTGQGGAVVTNDPEFATNIRNLIDHGGDWRKDRIHKRVGGNFRMTDIQATLGLEQFKHIDELINRRRQVHHWYSKYIPLSYETNGDGCFVIYESPVAPQLVAELRNRGVEASQLYQPVHFSEPFKEPEGTYPNAERAARTLVYLPYSLGLTKRQVTTVCKAVVESEKSILLRKDAA